MKKYQILINILDKIRSNAPIDLFGKYNPPFSETEKLNQARARAYIHLYLKVKFGILNFIEREHYITDGGYDGGIDGYYINHDNKTIYFVQSKFRIHEKNFEEKEIKLEEILAMDINRILGGEKSDEMGNSYNGKILQLQREISQLDNIGRFSYKVIILANLSPISDYKIRQLTGGFSTDIINHQNCYEDLIFPVISGTYFTATDLNINIDLSNKNAGSKISYTVLTKRGECEITVLFVPAIELGKIMSKYKNSILKFNPRSYLDLEGKKVNSSIRETIINRDTNEFALFNNGITMLSDETYINEKIGQKNKAQLIVKNPQIINGGQTSYTLSRIYLENIDNNVESLFQNKEVLLKIITLLDKSDVDGKIELIEEISTATNQQTPVNNADRFSNEQLHLKLQSILFDRYGLLYERKRGEFGDGVYSGYIENSMLVERNLFFRMYYASNGQINKSREKKLFLNQDFNLETLKDFNKLDNAYFGYLYFKNKNKTHGINQKISISIYVKIYAMTILYRPQNIKDYERIVMENYDYFEHKWSYYVETISKKYITKFKETVTKKGNKNIQWKYYRLNWYESDEFKNDLINYFKVDNNQKPLV